LGLQPALEWHIGDVSRRYGLNVTLQMEGPCETLPERYRTCVYRAVQEALTNCVRHAQARAVTVSVAGSNDRLAISVTDDGIGFKPVRWGAGLGLRGMEERVKELGGTMAIRKRAGGGTELAISLPRPATAAEVPCARAVS